jgi:hypothetical protein
MAEHYGGNDPGTGCALLMVAGSAGLIGFILGLIVAWALT